MMTLSLKFVIPCNKLETSFWLILQTDVTEMLLVKNYIFAFLPRDAMLARY